MQKLYFHCLLSLIMLTTTNATAQYLIVGTYTNNSPSEGIYVYDFNNKNGSAKKISHVKAGNPSYLAISKNGKFVYGVDESGDGKISSFAFDKKNGILSLINTEKNNGSAPCYVELDKTGNWLFAGNYSSGNLTLHPVNKDGSLGAMKQAIQHTGNGPDKNRQQTPHVHCTYISPDNKYLYVPDLGIDKVMIYPFNSATGALDEANAFFAKASAGGGPRHITFSGNGKFAYLIEEMSGTVVVFSQQNGRLTKIQEANGLTETERKKASGADIHLSPDGKFLYVSQRSNNTLQVFKVDINGKIKYLAASSTAGEIPRNFSIDPSGNYLLVANQNSNSVVILKRNKTTGLLTDTGKRIEVGKPVCLKWISK